CTAKAKGLSRFSSSTAHALASQEKSRPQAALHETGEQIACHSRARYDCTDRQIQTDKRGACCRDEDTNQNTADGFRRPKQRPPIKKYGAGIQRKGKPGAKDLLRNDRRAVSQRH